MRLTRILATTTALAATALLSMGVAGAVPAHADSTVPTATAIAGTLQSGFGTAEPSTLTVVTKGHGTLSVSVSTTTTVVRHGGNASALTELSAGDSLLIRGTFQSSTTFAATIVRDLSISRATIYGAVTAICNCAANATTVTMTPQRLLSGRGAWSTIRAKRLHAVPLLARPSAPTPASITFTLVPSTPATLANGTAGTTASVQVGMHVAVSGVYDRATHGFLSVSSMHIVS